MRLEEKSLQCRSAEHQKIRSAEHQKIRKSENQKYRNSFRFGAIVYREEDVGGWLWVRRKLLKK